MRILLFNHLLTVYDLRHGAQACHGVAGREAGLARGFAKLGWQADILTAVEGAKGDGLDMDWPGVRLVHADTVRTEDYDVVLLMESSSWQHLLDWKKAGKYPQAVKLFDHPFICTLVDGLSNVDEHIVRRAKLVGHVSHRNIPIWKERYKDGPPVFLSQWAAPSDLPFGQSNPYTRKPNLIFTGCMLPRYIDRLNDLAGSFDGDIWIVALFIALKDWKPSVMAPPSEDVISGYGLSEKGRAELFPYDNVKFVSDVRPAGYGIGPVVYGHFWAFLEHADAALGFTLRPGMLNEHIKCWDYEAYGLPIVHEQGSPLNDFTTRRPPLWLVPWNDTEAMKRAINDAVERKFDRKPQQEFIKQYDTWDNRAERWVKEIKEIK